MARAPRRIRRAMAKKAGVKDLLSVTIAIEGGAISEAVSKGASAWDLVVAHIDTALEQLLDQGGDPMAHGIITIGNDHPDYPGCVVIQAKTDRRLPERLSTEAELDIDERTAAELDDDDEPVVEVEELNAETRGRIAYESIDDGPEPEDIKPAVKKAVKSKGAKE